MFVFDYCSLVWANLSNSEGKEHSEKNSYNYTKKIKSKLVGVFL